MLTTGATYTNGSKGSSYSSFVIAIGDLEGSGHNDVVLNGPIGGQVMVYSNPGNGTLSPQVPIDVGVDVYNLVAADFDGDRTLDIGMTTLDLSPQLVQSVTLLLNQGKGVFSPPVSFPDFSPYGITTGDFNGDGHPDVATGNTSWVSVLLSRCE